MSAASERQQSRPTTGPPQSADPARGRRHPTHHAIEQRAFLLGLRPGGGDPVANWLRAERELEAELNPAAPRMGAVRRIGERAT